MNFFLKYFFVALAASAVLGFAFFLTKLGPQKTSPDTKLVAANTEETANLIAEAKAYEAKFKEATKLADPSIANIEYLEKAIAKVKEFTLKTGSTDAEILNWSRTMSGIVENVRGKKDFDDMQVLEAKAASVYADGRYEEAVVLYKALRDACESINNKYPNSKYYSLSAFTKADLAFQQVSVAPLVNQRNENEKAAAEAMQKEQWNEAEKFLNEAIFIQKKINNDFIRTIYASFPKVRELEVELDSLKTAPLNATVINSLKAAEDYEAKGKFIEAAENYKVAYDAQRELNTDFTRSRHASVEKLSEISVKLDTAFSMRLYLDIMEQKKQLDRLLMLGGDSPEIPTITEDLLLKCERLRKDHPQSSVLDEEIILSLRYLGFLGKNISKIHKFVLSEMIAISPESKVMMSKREISQEFYYMLMQEKPSRAQADANPVETVSYANAKDFCRRLSWILARPVSLPKPSEFREAIGSLKYVDLNAISWNASNSGVQAKPHPVGTKEPNTKGFYDLIGNVAEFVMPEDANDTPGIIGGSYQTWPDALSNIPYEKIEADDRGNRMVGFRIVFR